MSLLWKPTVSELAAGFQTTLTGGRYKFGRYRLLECQAFRDALLKVPGVVAVTIDTQSGDDFLYVTVFQDTP